MSGAPFVRSCVVVWRTAAAAVVRCLFESVIFAWFCLKFHSLYTFRVQFIRAIQMRECRSHGYFTSPGSVRSPFNTNIPCFLCILYLTGMAGASLLFVNGCTNDAWMWPFVMSLLEYRPGQRINETQSIQNTNHSRGSLECSNARTAFHTYIFSVRTNKHTHTHTHTKRPHVLDAHVSTDMHPFQQRRPRSRSNNERMLSDHRISYALRECVINCFCCKSYANFILCPKLHSVECCEWRWTIYIHSLEIRLCVCVCSAHWIRAEVIIIISRSLWSRFVLACGFPQSRHNYF